ncbi:MAG: outer membrane lipoprotein carrier protein LolA [Niabella sp.]
MKKFLTLALLLSVTTFSFAQKDPKAKVLLDGVSNKFKTYKTVSANFVYQVQNAAGKVLAKKNGVISMKGSKYNIALGGNKIISDGATVWNYDPAAKEVTVSDANNAASTITPQKLFTNFYEKDFNYTLGSVKKVGAKTVQEVVLKPTDTRKPFSRVHLLIDKATNTMASAEVYEKSGNKYVYTISSLKPNAAVSDAQFAFNKAAYPGVEIVDLR